MGKLPNEKAAGWLAIAIVATLLFVLLQAVDE